jgi:hypothetical protein
LPQAFSHAVGLHLPLWQHAHCSSLHAHAPPVQHVQSAGQHTRGHSWVQAFAADADGVAKLANASAQIATNIGTMRFMILSFVEKRLDRRLRDDQIRRTAVRR